MPQSPYEAPKPDDALRSLSAEELQRRLHVLRELTAKHLAEIERRRAEEREKKDAT